MVNRTQIESDLLRNIKSGIEIWQSAPETATMKEREIANMQKMSENLDEAISMLAVRHINNLMEAYVRQNGKYAPDGGYMINGITSDEELAALFGNVAPNSVRFIPAVRDQLRQQIYERMGFEGKLPTHEDIAALETKLEGCQSEEERLEIQEQIDLKKLALAEGPADISSDMPHVLASDIKNRYELFRSWSKQSDMSDTHTK